MVLSLNVVGNSERIGSGGGSKLLDILVGWFG